MTEIVLIGFSVLAFIGGGLLSIVAIGLGRIQSTLEGIRTELRNQRP